MSNIEKFIFNKSLSQLNLDFFDRMITGRWNLMVSVEPKQNIRARDSPRPKKRLYHNHRSKSNLLDIVRFAF